MNPSDRNKPTYLTLAEKAKLAKVAQRVNAQPFGVRQTGPSTYRGPQYNTAEFKLQEDLAPGGHAQAKFWYAGTEGDEVTIYAFGLNGTCEEGEIVVAYWWDGKWKFLAAEACPADDDEEEEEEE